MKKILLLLFFFSTFSGCVPVTPEKEIPANPQNIVFFIGDGMGPSQVTLGRLIKGELSMDQLSVTGKAKTWCLNNVVTDSAAGATALASGWKTNRGALSAVPGEKKGDWKNVLTLMEYLQKEKGYEVGLVTTTRLTDATPAGFLSHVSSRKMEDKIASQLIQSKAKVLMGGGGTHFLPFLFHSEDLPEADLMDKKVSQKIRQEFTFKRFPLPVQCSLEIKVKNRQWILQAEKEKYLIWKKEKNYHVYSYTALAEDAEKRGYHIITTRKGLQKIDISKRILGLFALKNMSFDVDRGPESTEPSLEEMTAKAIEILKATGKPFFLMVEGAKIDLACHAHDAVSMVAELASFDKSIGATVKWARENRRTLVVVTADHATGALGISLNFQKNYFHQQLSGGMLSADEMARRVIEGDEDPAHLLNHFAKVKMNGNEKRILENILKSKTMKPGDKHFLLSKTLGHAISERAGVYFYPLEYYGPKPPEHSGEDVPVYAYGPRSSLFSGTYENTEIPLKMAKALGVSFKPVFMENKKSTKVQ